MMNARNDDNGSVVVRDNVAEAGKLSLATIRHSSLINITILFIQDMKKTNLLLSALLVLSAQSAAAQTASTPKTGNTYYIYNVGEKAYLSADTDGRLTLSASGMPVTISQQDATIGTWHMTTDASNRISGTVLERTLTEGLGMYYYWNFTKLANGNYTIALRNSGVNAYSYLEYSALFDRLLRTPMSSASASQSAQWIFVSQSDYENVIVTLDQDATSYSAPNVSGATVRLKRSFTLDMWNTFCVPFDIDMSQLKSQLGDDVKLSEYTGISGQTIQFESVTTGGVTAGKPYLLKTTRQVPASGYYEFKNVTRFVASPTDDKHDGISYHGTFTTATVPSRSYVISQNVIYHTTSDLQTKGFRCWFVEGENAPAKISTWTLDGVTTDIDGTIADRPNANVEIYTVSGQCVNARSVDDLPQGVYLVNGKKVVRK